MANHASSLKRIRSNGAKRLRNRYQLKSTRTAIKKLRSTQDPTSLEPQLNRIHSMVDKLAKRRIIHRNRSADMKSKLTKYVSNVQTKTVAKEK